MVFKKFKELKLLLIPTILPILIGTMSASLFLYADLLKALGVGLVCSLAIGLALLLVATFFNRFSPDAWLITIAQFILLPITGLILTGLAFWPAMLAPQGSYLQLEPPPETATNFLQPSQQSIFGSKIYLQATSGQIYAYDCVTYQGCSWVIEAPETSQPDQNNAFGPGYCAPTDKPIAFMPPIHPTGVTDRLSIRSCGPDYEIQSKYVLLKDGRIFGWSRYWSVYEAIIGFSAFGLIGFITGLSTAIATFINRRRKNSHSPA